MFLKFVGSAKYNISNTVTDINILDLFIPYYKCTFTSFFLIKHFQNLFGAHSKVYQYLNQSIQDSLYNTCSVLKIHFYILISVTFGHCLHCVDVNTFFPLEIFSTVKDANKPASTSTKQQQVHTSVANESPLFICVFPSFTRRVQLFCRGPLGTKLTQAGPARPSHVSTCHTRINNPVC